MKESFYDGGSYDWIDIMFLNIIFDMGIFLYTSLEICVKLLIYSKRLWGPNASTFDPSDFSDTYLIMQPLVEVLNTRSRFQQTETPVSEIMRLS